MSPKANDLREMEAADLVKVQEQTRQEIFNLRFQLATGELENTARLSGARREMARIKTIARERGIELQAS